MLIILLLLWQLCSSGVAVTGAGAVASAHEPEHDPSSFARDTVFDFFAPQIGFESLRTRARLILTAGRCRVEVVSYGEAAQKAKAERLAAARRQIGRRSVVR